MSVLTTTQYKIFIIDIKEQIKLSQTKAITKVNQEMVMLYFNIGKIIFSKQQELGWGAKVIDNLSHDIKVEFPQLGGFSLRNIKRMVRFYKEYANTQIMPLPVAQLESQKMPLPVTQISWTHNTILIEKIKDLDLRIWYMQKIIEHGWSKDILSLMIKSEVHKREGKLISNFKDILSPNDSDLVQYSFKDPYIFDFLTIAEYSLKNMAQPIGISEYELTEVLPKKFESSLPTIQMIEDEFKSE